VAAQQPGSRVQLSLLRDGKEQNVSATLAELHAAAQPDDRAEAGADSSGFGMSIEPLTPETARQLGVSATSGLVVTDVRPGSRAADAGLRSGDVIVEVDRQAVNSVDALRSALKQGDRPALLLVQRGGATVFLTLERG
jgi:serine protease Do